MSTLSLTPVAKETRPRCCFYRANGSWNANADHAGSVTIDRRLVTGVTIFAKATGTNPAGTGYLFLYGVFGDLATEGDGLIEVNAGGYLPAGTSTVTRNALTNTALTTSGTIFPTVLSASGAMLHAFFGGTITTQSVIPAVHGIRPKSLRLSWGHGDIAAADMVWTMFGLLVQFGEA